MNPRTPADVRRVKLRITPAADAAVRAHHLAIGGSYSAAVCSLVVCNSERSQERRLEQLATVARAARQLGRAMARCLPSTPQHGELKALARLLDELHRSIGN